MSLGETDTVFLLRFRPNNSIKRELKLTLVASSPTFHRFSAPQPIVQRNFLQMRRAAVDAVNVTVDSHRVGHTVFRARIYGIVSGSVEQAAGRISGRRRSHRNPVHLPLEPIFTTLGHGRVDAFLKKRKKNDRTN